MHRPIAVVVLFFGSLQLASAQAIKIPSLQELDQADAIAHHPKLLTRLQLRLLIRTSSSIVKSCVQDPAPDDARTANETLARFRVKRMRIDVRGQTAVVVQGDGACMCGAVGNCPFWLLSDRPTPSLLLNVEHVQMFAWQKRKATGQYDLLLAEHDSAMQAGLQWFRFDGSKYKRLRCGAATWPQEAGTATQIDIGRCD